LMFISADDRRTDARVAVHVYRPLGFFIARAAAAQARGRGVEVRCTPSWFSRDGHVCPLMAVRHCRRAELLACSLAGRGRHRLTDTFRLCPGRRGRFSTLGVFPCKSVFYGAFVWARGALNRQKRRFLARAATRITTASSRWTSSGSRDGAAGHRSLITLLIWCAACGVKRCISRCCGPSARPSPGGGARRTSPASWAGRWAATTAAP
jgi:hypothetical protein